ncbi:hypothetical protein SEUCBS139899_009404 [Sporothrix eucalyptigena]|uniref:DUF1742-domain-containing protein n=1 Tax=Sporothrix eucalyptigena TaxID=1812306 RepID=A0ABP0D1M3_9PEZI
MSFPNIYTHRKVAEGSAKGCEICFKPTSSVLITPENKDFFYICPVHLKDRGFCTPIVDKAAEEAKKKKAEEDKEAKMKEEIELVKKEYEEKQKKKKKEEKDKEKEAEKEKDKDKKDDKDKEKDKKGDKDDKDKKKDEKEAETPATDEPRVFALQKFVYQQRLDKKRQAEIAKRNRERMSNPSFFPSVPKGLP